MTNTVVGGGYPYAQVTIPRWQQLKRKNDDNRINENNDGKSNP